MNSDREPLPNTSSQRPSDLYTRRQRGALLLVLFLVGASNYIDKNIIGVLLEPIKTEFQVSDTQLGLLTGISFALFYATLGIPMARWADRGDRKLIVTLSLAIWSAMTALCGVASTFWQLAAARFGVGAGEAGAIPPAQSLLVDYFPPAERARAIGLFMMSAIAGYAVGLVLAGWVAQHFGWRAAFFCVGLFGIALTPFTHLLLKEPRNIPQFAPESMERESVLTAFRVLLAKPTYRNILMGIVAYFLMAYGARVFLISFMIRIHGLNVAQAGATFGIVSAIGAVVGTLCGGTLSDRLALRDPAWLPRLTAYGMLAALPSYEGVLCAPTVTSMAALLLLSEALFTGVIPPMLSGLHAVCGSKRRAMAVAVAFFFANLIGLGLGPVIGGSLSDSFAVAHGSAVGLRYALMITLGVLFPAACFMLRAAQRLKEDVED